MLLRQIIRFTFNVCGSILLFFVLAMMGLLLIVLSISTTIR